MASNFVKQTRPIIVTVLVAILAVAGILLIMGQLAAPETAPVTEHSNTASQTTPQHQATATASQSHPETAPQTTTGDDTVATVNNKVITRQAWQQATQLDTAMSRLTFQPIPTAEETLDRLVNEIVILEEFDETTSPTAKEIEARVSELISVWNVSTEDLEATLAETGLKRTDLDQRVGRLIQVEAALNQLAEQEADVNAWLVTARAKAEIGLYRSLAASVAPTPSAITTQQPTQTNVETGPPAPEVVQEFVPPPDLPVSAYPENAAPDFTLAQLDGEPLTLSNFRGKPTVINFWASWCPPCRRELPALQTAYQTYKDDIGFLAVDVKEPPEVVAPFVEDMGLTFPVVMDPDGAISNGLYQVRGLPTTLFIDARGVVAARHVGPLDETLIDNYLSPLLNAPLVQNAAPGDDEQPMADGNDSGAMSADSTHQQTSPMQSEADLPAAPDFTLTAADGAAISLQDYRDKKNVVLVFYRGRTWGICLSQLVQLQANLTQFENTDTQVIALAVQDQAAAQGSVNDTGVTYPILADPDHNVTDAYGVYNLLGDGVATPAVFVINKSGQISWSYIGQNINDRPANSTILANLPQ